MIDKPWIAPLVGAVVFVFGLALLRWNRQSWRQQKNDSALEDHDREYYYRRYRRRVQMAALLLVVGVLVAVGEVIGDWVRRPGLFAVYWGGVLLLLAWVLLLSFGDMASTAAHSRVGLARLRQQRRELEQRLAEFRERRLNERGSE